MIYEVKDFKYTVPGMCGIRYWSQFGVLEVSSRYVSMRIKDTVGLNRACIIQRLGAGKCFLPDIEEV